MLKLALLQCDVKNGDLGANASKILDFCHKAPSGALCIAPFEALAGPYAACCAKQPDFTQMAAKAVEHIAASLEENRMLLCGMPPDKRLLVRKDSVMEIGPTFIAGGMAVGIDLEPEAYGDIMLNIHMTSRPFTSDSQNEWEMILSGAARQAVIWSASVNLCGGYGSHIFNGQSVVMDPAGRVAARAAAFAEDCLILDPAMPERGRIEPLCACVEEARWLALKLGLQDFMRKNGVNKALIGLSGGMDSALVACIAQDALGAPNVTGVMLPSRYTSPDSLRDARKLAANLGISIIEIPIEPMVAACSASLAPGLAVLENQPGNLMAENLQARLRGVILMALANASGAFVLNTGNKSEAAMGYSTLYGDTVGALAVIGDLFKTEVYNLAKWRCKNSGRQIIPQNIFDRPPTAELAPDQKDTDSLPPYDELDPDLAKIMSFSQELSAPENSRLRALRTRVAAAAFKRAQCPPALLISSLRNC